MRVSTLSGEGLNPGGRLKPLKMLVLYIQREFDLSFCYGFLTLTLLKPCFLQWKIMLVWYKMMQNFEKMKTIKMFVFYIQREFDLSFYYMFLTLTLLKAYFLQWKMRGLWSSDAWREWSDVGCRRGFKAYRLITHIGYSVLGFRV